VEFLRTHPVKQGGKTIEQHLERLHIAVLFRQREILRLPVNLGLE